MFMKLRSDKYDPLEYGREFDFSRPFFEQFRELMEAVPHLNMIGSNNLNCGYCHLIANCKNCYMIVESSNNEDCYYGYWLQKCLGCVDCSYCHECKYCYECDNCYNSYDLRWSKDCNNCSNSYFMRDCVGCKDCFGCANLVQKQYHVFNEDYGKERYEEFINKIDFTSSEEISKWGEKASDFWKTAPVKFAHITNSENCTGDYIVDSRECEECFHAHDAEFCKYGEHVWRGSRHNMDVSTVGREAELIYEAINTGISSYNVQFAVQNWTCSDMRYCYGCFNSSNNFGCVGLKKHKYCIFNKQYSAEEYGKVMNKIVDHMIEGGEWGRFFPREISPFAYNETAAFDQLPLKKETALKYGWKWMDRDEKEYKKASGEVLACRECGKNYKYIEQELAAYEKLGVPLPLECFDCRHMRRINLRNKNRLVSKKCDKCGIDMKTTYSLEREEKVYCEKCYLEQVY